MNRKSHRLFYISLSVIILFNGKNIVSFDKITQKEVLKLDE